MMDGQTFEADERRRGVRKSLTDKAIREVARLEAYLASREKTLEEATPSDVESYLEERTLSTASALDVPGLGRFFVHLENRPVVEATQLLRLRYTTPLRLRDLLDVDSSHIAALETMGIRTNSQILRRAPTAEARAPGK